MGDVTKAGQLGDGSDNRRVCPETGVQLFDQDAGARPPVGLAKELQDLLVGHLPWGVPFVMAAPAR